MLMTLTTATLSSSLQSIGISQAKGVDIPLLREQNSATLKGIEKPASSSSGSETTAPAKTAAPEKGTRYTASTLTPEQQRQVATLQQIERNVVAHEQAHMAAGHEVITSGPNYTYTYGPDGKRYATGGEVGIDTSPERTPEANIDKGILIQAAALAPKDPSPQDYQVAAIGGRLETQGRSDLSQQQQVAQQEQAEAAKAQQAAQTESSTASSAVQATNLATPDRTPALLQTQGINQGQAAVKAYGAPSEGGEGVNVFA